MLNIGEETMQEANAVVTSDRIVKVRRTIRDWVDHQLGMVGVNRWPTSVKYWFHKIDSGASAGPDCPAAVIGFMTKSMAYQSRATCSETHAGSQGAAERDGFSFAEYMGIAPSCSDSFYYTQAVTWYEARLSQVPEDRWTAEVTKWAEALSNGLGEAPSAMVLGWLGQVVADPTIPSDLFEPLGNVMRTF